MGNDIKLTEYYGGIRCATASLPSDFVTRTYCDSDRDARTVFELNNPGMRTHGSTHDAMAVGSSFRDEATRCGVAFCGPSCNDISRLNHFRDSNASDARLFADTVNMIAVNNHKLGVIETPVAIFDDDKMRTPWLRVRPPQHDPYRLRRSATPPTLFLDGHSQRRVLGQR